MYKCFQTSVFSLTSLVSFMFPPGSLAISIYYNLTGDGDGGTGRPRPGARRAAAMTGERGSGGGPVCHPQAGRASAVAPRVRCPDVAPATAARGRGRGRVTLVRDRLPVGGRTTGRGPGSGPGRSAGAGPERACGWGGAGGGARRPDSGRRGFCGVLRFCEELQPLQPQPPDVQRGASRWDSAASRDRPRGAGDTDSAAAPSPKALCSSPGAPTPSSFGPLPSPPQSLFGLENPLHPVPAEQGHLALWNFHSGRHLVMVMGWRGTP